MDNAKGRDLHLPAEVPGRHMGQQPQHLVALLGLRVEPLAALVEQRGGLALRHVDEEGPRGPGEACGEEKKIIAKYCS